MTLLAKVAQEYRLLWYISGVSKDGKRKWTPRGGGLEKDA